MAIFSRQSISLYAGGLAARGASPSLDAFKMAKFVDPLPPSCAKSLGLRPVPGMPKVQAPYFRLAMNEFTAKVHRDLPPTRLWGYNRLRRAQPSRRAAGRASVEWVNQLPTKHFMPIDHNLHGAEADKPEVRAIVHVHGAKVPPDSDGYPDNWYVPGKSATYYYPNQQDPATLWYHDHAMGINRLNIYAGIFGLFIVRDRVEDALNLPKGRYEIPLVICDRSFRQDGQLDYPVSGIPDARGCPRPSGKQCW